MSLMTLRQRLTLSDGMGCAFNASWLGILMPDLMVTRGNLDEAMALIQDEIERIMLRWYRYRAEALENGAVRDCGARG